MPLTNEALESIMKNLPEYSDTTLHSLIEQYEELAADHARILRRTQDVLFTLKKERETRQRTRELFDRR